MPGAKAQRERLVRELLRSEEPSVRWRTRVKALGEPRSSASVRSLETQIRRSERAARLLTEGSVGRHHRGAGGIYRYWQGIHWALAALVDIGYPRGDRSVAPLLDRALGHWTDSRYGRTVKVSESARGTFDGVPLLSGRYRRCASQQGNALLYATELGPLDTRADRLASWLRRWQWDDGGWNCAATPKAHVSSFMETLTPMRGLAAYAERTGSTRARAAADRAAEVFLERRLFRRRSNGRVMRSDFLRLHYPVYWHYDVLAGLKGLAELGRISDPRCRGALDWLEDRELSTGGWPADARFYRVSDDYRFGCEYVDWGAPRAGLRNDWVTTDALYVLRVAGRAPD